MNFFNSSTVTSVTLLVQRIPPSRKVLDLLHERSVSQNKVEGLILFPQMSFYFGISSIAQVDTDMCQFGFIKQGLPRRLCFPKSLTTLVSHWPEGRWRTGEAVHGPNGGFTRCRGGGFCSSFHIIQQQKMLPIFLFPGWIKQAHLYPRDTFLLLLTFCSL